MEKRVYFDPRFNGTEEYHKVSLGFPLATDSVVFFAEKYGAFWLLDIISSYFDKYDSYFAVVFFDLDGKGGGDFHVHEDYDSEDPESFPAIVSQHVEYTDLPVNVKFYIENGILMFPSDY